MRNNRLILLLSFLLICGASLAQPRLRFPEVYVGAHVGAMASTMIFKPTIQGVGLSNILITPNAGLVFRYAGHKVCAVQVELNYKQRGWKEVLDNVNYTRQLDYIELPLLMHLYFGGKHVRGFLNLGPQIGYCIRDIATGNPNPQYKYQYTKIQKQIRQYNA